MNSDAQFETLMDALDDAEQHRDLFAAAWRSAPEGFASLVADALRYAPKKPTARVFAAVLANEHLAIGRAALNVQADAWVVHVETPGDGVKPHRFATSNDAAQFVSQLVGAQWVSDPDPRTREVYVLMRATQVDA